MGSPAYIDTKIHKYRGTHGASRAPPPSPLFGRGAPPARDPSDPGGSLPVIVTPATAAL